MYSKSSILCVICIGLIYLCNGQTGPKVSISNGQLEGIYLRSRSGRTYSAFMGIPYGNQPKKFEEAEPASNWSGVKNVSKFGSVCTQFDPIKYNAIIGSENCLFINVFTPKVEPLAPLSTLVYIHGGGFEFGNSDDHGADYLMDEDVVFITLNYRLGAYGFLSTGNDGVIPGNLGLKDQVLALKWIQQNIAHFGGNPNLVTLSGVSAGGGSVGLHIVSPRSRGLFHRAICASGCGLHTWAFVKDPMVETLKLAQRLNCSTSSSIEIKECLKTKTIQEIYAPLEQMQYRPPFGPIIELGQSSTSFLPATPRELYKIGQFAKVPLLVTGTEDEGLLMYSAAIMKNKKWKEEVNENWGKWAPDLFYYDDYTRAVQDEISAAILKFYFSNQQPIITEATFQNLTNVGGDALFMHGSRESALTHARHGGQTYAGIWSFDGIWSHIFESGYTKPIGMGHADDLQYLVTNEVFPIFPLGSESLEFSKKLIRVYLDFANFGHPNLPNWKPVSNEEVTSQNVNWMYLRNKDHRYDARRLETRMKFWDEMHSLPFKQNSDQVNRLKNEL